MSSSAASATPYDHQLKLLLIGDSAVGKSSILLRFTDDTFSDKHAATIGVDFKTRDMNFQGRRIRTTVWDTAGQEKFRSLTSSYYRGTHGIVLVYDVTNRDSFQHVEDWLQEIETYCSEDECVKLLVGNKIDLEARAVTSEEGQRFAREKNMVFIETSAKTTAGIRQTFEELVQKVLENPTLEADTRPKDKSNIIKQTEHTEASDAGGGGGCC